VQNSAAKAGRARTARWLWALALLSGGVAGAGSALALSGGLMGGASAGVLRAGQWSTDLTVGATAASPWVRARIARVGLLALPRSETVYFDRRTDEAGDPLDGRCTYRLNGQPIPARWWSVTLYGADQMLARNEDSAASVDLTRLGPDRWSAVIGPRAPVTGEPWLSTAGAPAPILMIRLYNPDPADDAALAALRLPSVEKLGCEQPAASGGQP
jgi:hypothetical protein